jgi:hypothetical protein
MKVLDLQCPARHAFEGWFASEDDFQSQLSHGLVGCPLCADSRIVKLPSAPRLNLGGHSATDRTVLQPAGLAEGGVSPSRATEPASASDELSTSTTQPPMQPELGGQAGFLKALRQIVAQTENVGDRFALEARRMHYGEIEARSIRGQATQRETIDLLEEGVEIMPLPLPAALKETLQ